MKGGQMWAIEEGMLGHEGGISPTNSGNPACGAAARKKSVGVPIRSRVGMDALNRATLSGRSSGGAHRSKPQFIKSGPLVVAPTSATSFLNRAALTASDSIEEAKKRPQPYPLMVFQTRAVEPSGAFQ